MPECIEREAALESLCVGCEYVPIEEKEVCPYRFTGCQEYANIFAIPAADVVPVRHGRWEWNPDGMDWGLGAWCCSECKSKAETWWANDRKYNPRHCSGGHFCGNCGALMDKDGD